MKKERAEKILNFWMNEKLPTVAQQKRQPYRPDLYIVRKTWRVLNATCFNNELKMPAFTFHSRKSWWAMCCSDAGRPRPLKTTSCCEIQLSDKWFCRLWFIDTLAHEMAHQYQWDIDGVKRVNKGWEPIMSHGPSFFKHRDNIDKYGMSLKVCHRNAKWFKYQSLKKC